MVHNHKEVENRRTSSAGFSLTELLATVLIMSFVMLGITAGIGAAMRSYYKIKMEANAQTLMATVVNAVNMDLRTASGVRGGTDNLEFYSANRGFRMSYTQGSGKDNEDKTNIYIRSSTDAAPIPIVTGKTKTSELAIAIKFDEVPSQNSGFFKYTLTISSTDQARTSMAPLKRIICVRPIQGMIY